MDHLVKRIVREQQILDKEELKVGVVVEEHNQQVGYTPRLLILSEPYTDDKGRWWVAVLHCELSAITSISLADHSVIPYPDGSWNSLQYLVKVGESPKVMIFVSVAYQDDYGEVISSARGYSPLKRHDLIHLLIQGIDI